MCKKLLITPFLLLTSFFAWSNNTRQSTLSNHIMEDPRKHHTFIEMQKYFSKNPDKAYLYKKYSEMDDTLREYQKYGDTVTNKDRMKMVQDIHTKSQILTGEGIQLFMALTWETENFGGFGIDVGVGASTPVKDVPKKIIALLPKKVIDLFPEETIERMENLFISKEELEMLDELSQPVKNPETGQMESLTFYLAQRFVNSGYKCENFDCPFNNDSAGKFVYDKFKDDKKHFSQFEYTDEQGNQHFLSSDELFQQNPFIGNVVKNSNAAQEAQKTAEEALEESQNTQEEVRRGHEKTQKVLENEFTAFRKEKQKSMEHERQNRIDQHHQDIQIGSEHQRLQPIQQQQAIQERRRYDLEREETRLQKERVRLKTELENERKKTNGKDSAQTLKIEDDIRKIKHKTALVAQSKKKLKAQIEELETAEKITRAQIPLDEAQEWGRAIYVTAQLVGAPPSFIKATQATMVGLEMTKSILSMVIAGAIDPTGITAVLTGVSALMQIFGDTGPTPDQIIIDTLQEVKANQAQMLEMLGQLDSKIDGLQDSINDLKNILAKSHAEIIGKLDEIHKELRVIGQRLYNIESKLQEDRTKERERRTHEAQRNYAFLIYADQLTLYDRYAQCKQGYKFREAVSITLLETRHCVSQCVFQAYVFQQDPYVFQQDPESSRECSKQCKNTACDQNCVQAMIDLKADDISDLQTCFTNTNDKLKEVHEALFHPYRESRAFHKSSVTITNHTDVYDPNKKIIDPFPFLISTSIEEEYEYSQQDPSQRVSQLPDIFKILYNSAKKLTTPNDEDEISRTEAIGKVVEDLNNNTTLLKHPNLLDSQFVLQTRYMEQLPHPSTLPELGLNEEIIYKEYQLDNLDELCKEVKYIEGVSEYSRQHIENALYIYSSHLKVLHRGIISSVTKTINKLGKLDRDYTPNDKKYENHKSAIMHFLSQPDYIPRSYKEPERVSNHLLRSRTHLARRVDSRLTDQDEEELMNRGFEKESEHPRCERTQTNQPFTEANVTTQLQYLQDTLTALQRENAQGGCWFNDIKGVITGRPGTKVQLYQKRTRINRRGTEVDDYVPMCAVFVTQTKIDGTIFLDELPTHRSICLEADLDFITESADQPTLFPNFFSDDQIYYLTERDIDSGHTEPRKLKFENYFADSMNFFLNDEKVPLDLRNTMFNKYTLLTLITLYAQNTDFKYTDEYLADSTIKQLEQLYSYIGSPPDFFKNEKAFWLLYLLALVYEGRSLGAIDVYGGHSLDGIEDVVGVPIRRAGLRNFIHSNNINIDTILKSLIHSIEEINGSPFFKNLRSSSEHKLEVLTKNEIDLESLSKEFSSYYNKATKKLIGDVMNLYTDTSKWYNSMKINNEDNQTKLDTQETGVYKNRDSYGKCRKYACLKEIPIYEFDKDKWQEVAQTELLNHIETIKEELLDNKKFKALLTDARKVHFGLSTLIRFGYGDERLHNDPQLVELKNLLIYLENFTDRLLSEDTGEQWRAIYNLNRHIQSLFKTVKEMGGNHLESIIPNVSPQEYGIGQLGLRKEAFDNISKNEHWNVQECSYP